MQIKKLSPSIKSTILIIIQKALINVFEYLDHLQMISNFYLFKQLLSKTINHLKKILLLLIFIQ